MNKKKMLGEKCAETLLFPHEYRFIDFPHSLTHFLFSFSYAYAIQMLDGRFKKKKKFIKKRFFSFTISIKYIMLRHAHIMSAQHTTIT
jgi:hypothetical protein